MTWQNEFIPTKKGPTLPFTRLDGSETTRRIEYITPSDDKGRCRFWLYWWADYHPGDKYGEYRHGERCQIFFADPVTHGFPRPEEYYADDHGKTA
jgi:hypothetical protein